MDFKKMCVIPQCNFEAFGDVRGQFDTLAKEHLCNWIRRKKDIPFDYGEILEQIQIVKTQFPQDERDYVLRCYEQSFAVKILLPEILSWSESRPHISLAAILYTISGNMNARPSHLLSATLGTNPATGQSNGAIFAKRSTDFGNFAVTQSFKISDFEHPDRAKVEYLSLK
jgi:hypothetical protein